MAKTFPGISFDSIENAETREALGIIHETLKDWGPAFKQVSLGKLPDASGSSAGIVLDHGDLLGLSDDDHSQYPLMDGRDTALNEQYSSYWMYGQKITGVTASIGLRPGLPTFAEGMLMLRASPDGSGYLILGDPDQSSAFFYNWPAAERWGFGIPKDNVRLLGNTLDFRHPAGHIGTFLQLKGNSTSSRILYCYPTKADSVDGFVIDGQGRLISGSTTYGTWLAPAGADAVGMFRNQSGSTRASLILTRYHNVTTHNLLENWNDHSSLAGKLSYFANDGNLIINDEQLSSDVVQLTTYPSIGQTANQQEWYSTAAARAGYVNPGGNSLYMKVGLGVGFGGGTSLAITASSIIESHDTGDAAFTIQAAGDGIQFNDDSNVAMFLARTVTHVAAINPSHSYGGTKEILQLYAGTAQTGHLLANYDLNDALLSYIDKDGVWNGLVAAGAGSTINESDIVRDADVYSLLGDVDNANSQRGVATAGLLISGNAELLFDTGGSAGGKVSWLGAGGGTTTIVAPAGISFDSEMLIPTLAGGQYLLDATPVAEPQGSLRVVGVGGGGFSSIPITDIGKFLMVNAAETQPEWSNMFSGTGDISYLNSESIILNTNGDYVPSVHVKVSPFSGINPWSFLSLYDPVGGGGHYFSANGTFAGTTNSIFQIANGTIYQTNGIDVAVADGGTGASTLTDHGVLVGSGAGAVTALAVGTTNQVLVGSTGADPAFGAVPSNALLDGSRHSDTVASLQAEGSIIVADFASNWKELGIGTSGQLFRSTGVTAAWHTLQAGDIPQLAHSSLSNLSNDDHSGVYPAYASSQTISGLWDFSNVGGLKTDVIAESTAAGGITLDSRTLIKDGLVTTTGEYTVAESGFASTDSTSGNWVQLGQDFYNYLNYNSVLFIGPGAAIGNFGTPTPTHSGVLSSGRFMWGTNTVNNYKFGIFNHNAAYESFFIKNYTGQTADSIKITDSADAEIFAVDPAGNIAAAGALTLGTDLAVADGGTGASTLLDHGVLLGSGTAAVSVAAVGTTDQVLVGATGADPAFGPIPAHGASVHTDRTRSLSWEYASGAIMLWWAGSYSTIGAHQVANFHNTWDSGLAWTFRLPQDYASGGTWKVWTSGVGANAAGDETHLELSYLVIEDGDDPTAAADGTVEADVVPNATANIVNIDSLGSGSTGFAAGHLVKCYLRRDISDESPTYANLLNIWSISFEYTADM